MNGTGREFPPDKSTGMSPVTLQSTSRYSSVTCSLMAALLMAGCGGGGSSQPPPPTLQTKSFQVLENQTLVATLGATDPEGSALTLTVDAPPSHGALTGPDTTGAFTYQPVIGFYGSDSFHVAAVDTQGRSTSASISLEIQRLPPTATADATRTAPGVTVTINVLANDSDLNGLALTPQMVSQSPNGNAVVNGDGTIAFRPSAGFAGTATLSYKDSNSKGDVSQPASIQIEVRPLQKALYLTSSHQILLDDTNTIRSVTTSGTEVPQGVSLSKNGRTLLYSATPQPGETAWYASDLQGSLTGQFVADTGGLIGSGDVVLSDDGTLALYPVDGVSGIYNSTEAFLVGLYGSQGGKLGSGDYSTEQINNYYFGNDDQNIYYISHAPANYSSNSTVYATTVANPGSRIQIGTSSGYGDTVYAPLRITQSGSQVVYVATRSNNIGLYAIDSASPGTEVLLGPSGHVLNSGITGFDIACQGHYGAYVLQSNSGPGGVPTNAYLVDLDHPGVYAVIGSGFSNETSLGAPLFSPDGQHILLWSNTGAGVALFETSVAQPSVLVQQSPSYPSTSSIATFRYTPDGLDIVYAVDAQTTGSYDIYIVQRSNPGVAAQLDQALGTSVYGPFLDISSDSTTIAYAQPESPGGALSLFLVDRTTPGLPFKLADNIDPVQFVPQPFYTVP
jgi:Big-like domain-containing protein